MFKFILLALALFACPPSYGQVYKCKAGNGHVTYQQSPCTDDSKQERVRVWAQPTPTQVYEARIRAAQADESRYFERRQSNRPRLLPSISGRTSLDSAPPSLDPLAYKRKRKPKITTRTGPGYTEPSVITDQYGNRYDRPPGSAFATDPKTGKQCFVYGDFIKCP